MYRVFIKHKKYVFLTAVLVVLFVPLVARVNAAATITVNTTNDNLTAGDGNCTLREAMTNSNNDTDSTSGDCTAGSGTDAIEFAIAPFDSSVKTISPSSALPNITDTVTIDGSTQDNADCSTHTIKIEIDYSGYVGLAMGFLVGAGDGASGTTIKGLSIVNATQHGIFSYSPNTTIACNNIGVKADGTTAGGMDGSGVLLYPGTTGSVVGGASVSDRNVISGNTGSNVAIFDDNTTISGNYVGTDVTGNTALVGGSNGIAIYSSDNIIGGTTSAERNIISGNAWLGIAIAEAGQGVPSGNVIKGNYIGLGADGTTDLGNNGVGVWLVDGASSNTIGGDTSGERNVISGNSGHGVHIEGGSNLSNIVSGNYIGTNAAGTTDLGNDDAGVLLDNTSGNTVGGLTSGERNVISGNASDGIWLYGDSADNNFMQGNYIGTNAAGTGDIGNTNNGINISASADSNLVGGTVAGASNLIWYNNGNGVIVPNAGSLNNAIIGNSLYQNATPNIDLSDDGVTANDANDGDSGPNDLLNFPEWSTYTESAGNTEVEYTLDVPAGDYRIETFSGNGKTLIDSQDIMHTGSGVENFNNTITGVGFHGLRMTTTEIDGGLSSGFGATSEYSEAYSNSSGTSTITVNSTADDTDDDGECTLREAITTANDNTESGISDGECIAGSNEDTIEFDISGPDYTIQPLSALPSITDDNVTINGYSQTGTVENSGDYSACFVGTILIEIDGQNAGATSGITIYANNVTVRGLAINRFEQSGVNIGVVDGAVVAGNILGLDDAGLVDLGNGDAGVAISSTGDTLIGGTTAADRNLISGNEGYGGISSYADAGTVTISGNCIGTDATGDTAIPNNHQGINLFETTASTFIGGNTTHERNIISGNDEMGISLNDSSIDSITGNYIGVDVDGEADLGNGNSGIYVDGDSAVSNIGGVTSGERNVISGNGQSGILLSSGASGVTVSGNYIGLGADGITDLGNTDYGVSTQGDNTIGGTIAGARNVISGNGSNGITADSSTIIGNYIGLSADGTSSVTNGNANLANVSLANNNQFGGTSANARNYIAGNNGTANGIGLTGTTPFGGSSTSDNVVQGNCIGTNSDCEVEAGFGVGAGLIVSFDTSNNVIGGTANGAGNTIAGNREGIIVLSLSSGGFHPLNNSILGNSIHSNDGGLVSGLINLEGIGIDLLETPNFGSFPELGVTANDASDADAGPNDYLNFPVLNSSSASAGSLDVNFDLDIPNVNAGVTGYRVEFFANDTGDASGNGEGQIYLGSADVAGDVTAQTETITLDPGVVTTGDYDISATVTEIDGSTDGFGATSEFSAFLNDQSVIQPLDNDDDGVNDAVENAGPNGGDGNDDGTLDSEQSSVATILDNTGDNYLTLALDPDGTCNAIDDFSASTEAEQAKQEEGYDYPMGLNSFTIPCADSVDGTIYYHGHTDLSDYTHRKFGPTVPGDISSNGWYDSGFTSGTATVNGATVVTTSFSLTDGSLGDDTGADDIIVDDNGFGIEVSDSVVDSISEAASDVISGFLAKTGSGVVPAVSGAIFIILLSSRSIYIARKRSISHHK